MTDVDEFDALAMMGGMAQSASQEHAERVERVTQECQDREAEATQQVAKEFLMPSVSISIYNATSGSPIWGPAAVKSSMLVLELRRTVAQILGSHQYMVTLIKGSNTLDYDVSLEVADISDGDVLLASVGLSSSAAKWILTQCSTAGSTEYRKGMTDDSACEFLTRMAAKLGIDPDDSNAAWHMEIQPWLKAWLMTGFTVDSMRVSDMTAKDGGLLVLHESGADDTSVFLLVDVLGNLADFRGETKQAGALFVLELWCEDFDAFQSEDEWNLDDLRAAVDAGLDLSTDIFSGRGMYQTCLGLTEFFTTWALTRSKLPSEMQIKKAQEGDQFVF